MAKKVLVIGCGVAGAVVALGLKRAGFMPEIYEGRAGHNKAEGVFLTLAQNGLNALKVLGLDKAVLASGDAWETILFQNDRGKSLGRVLAGSLIIRRDTLHALLRDAAGQAGIPIYFDKWLKDATETEQGVTATFEDGSTAQADLLIGADGIHSATRRALFKDAPQPQYTGIMDYGAFASSEGLKPSGADLYMIFGKLGFFGYYVGSREANWFASFKQKQEPTRDEIKATASSVWKQKLLDAFEGDIPIINQIINQTTGDIGAYPAYNLPVLDRWHTARVCLVGDGAHAMLPHAGQGASLALEDAVLLAKCLRDIADTTQAFATFQTLRRDHVAKVLARAKKNGSEQLTAPSAFGRFMRDLIMPHLLKKRGASSQWIYRYEIDWDSKVEPSRAPLGK